MRMSRAPIRGRHGIPVLAGNPRLRRRVRAGARVLALVLVASLVAPLGPATRAGAAGPGAQPDEELNTLWNGYAYGDAGDHWTGGDCASSIPLPDGRVVWMYCDTFLGMVNPDHSRPPGTPMVRDAMVVQQGNTLTTRHGGTVPRPESLVGPAAGGSGAVAFWPGDGTVAGNRLRVLYTRMTMTGDGPLDFRPGGTVLADFTLPDLEPAGRRALPLSERVSWGMSVLEEPDHTYVYGVEDRPGAAFLHLARTRPGDLGGRWEFFTGTGWSPQERKSARLMSGVGHGFSVDRIDGRYVLVTVDSHLAFSSNLVAYFAARPAGPFRDEVYLYSAPEPSTGAHRIVYDARAHPELSSPGKLVVSYNVNSLSLADVYADARLYRPRFIDVRLPSGPPDPSTLPPAPSGLTAQPGDPAKGTTRLTWTGSRSGDWYWIYQRDVTAGHTGFGRLLLPVTSGTSVELGHLVDGHTYEFKVTTIREAGESPPSSVVTVLADVPPPPVPGNVRAAPNADGKIAVAWDAPWDGLQYSVYQRDVTAGEARFRKLGLPTSATSLDADYLTDQHTYEFAVSTVRSGVEGRRSDPVRAVCRFGPPPAPANLTATPGGGAGTVNLAWDALGDGLWYFVYRRDITAGESRFTRLAYPVTSGASTRLGSLARGHLQEYAVGAINQAGEGPRSASVQVTVE